MSKRSVIPNKIITFLRGHPTATREDISQALDVSYQVVQKHLYNLTQEGVVRPGFIVDHSGVQGKYKYWVMIQTVYNSDSERIYEKGGEKEDDFGKNYQLRLCKNISNELREDIWAEHISLRSMDIVFSAPWDILVGLDSNNQVAIGFFITQYLRTHHAVSDTSTAWSPPDFGSETFEGEK